MLMTRLIITGLLVWLNVSMSWASNWQVKESIKYYKVKGETGAALYKSIGLKGPVIAGARRTIAVTNWDLKWRRNYQPKGNACELVAAQPFVQITYTLPKPAHDLSANVGKKWQRFSDGIKAHEKIHGDYVKKLTQDIIDTTVGLHVENDKACKNIRKEVLVRVSRAFERYKADNRAFEKAEMRANGPIQQLILDLVK